MSVAIVLAMAMALAPAAGMDPGATVGAAAIKTDPPTRAQAKPMPKSTKPTDTPATRSTSKPAAKPTEKLPTQLTTKAATAHVKPKSDVRAPEQPTPIPVRLADRRLSLYRRELGGLTPKSVVASPAGYVFAQNMIYKHTVAVFDVDGNRVTDISDKVPRSLLGLDGDGYVRGAPVEGAVSPDGKRLYVSNYYILGKGFTAHVSDTCKSKAEEDLEAERALRALEEGRPYQKPIEDVSKKHKINPSYVYEIDIDNLQIVRAFQVGATPKFLTVTPDGSRLLVTNWCDFTLSIVDLRGQEPTHHVRIGSFPRGIAVEPDGKTAYVTSFSKKGLAVVDLERREVVRWLKGGRGPRHLVLGPEGHLYVSLSHEGRVAVIDKNNGEVIASVRTGKDPRSIAISSDGSALYVANYREASLAVVDTATMRVVQKIATGPYPIGVAFEPRHERVWVSCYAGSVRLYDTRGAAPHRSVLALLRDEAKRFPP